MSDKDTVKNKILEDKNFDILDGVISVFLVRGINGIFGKLTISNYTNELDNHCEQCQNEPILWFGFGQPFPMIFGDIGTEKYERYKNNMISILGSVEIVERVW